MKDTEPVCIAGILQTLRGVCSSDGRLMQAIEWIGRQADPLSVNFNVTVGEKSFTPRQLTEAWVSRYFHTDRIVPELESLPLRECSMRWT